jgi:uncharacterized protein (TIGR02145 family)
VEIVEKTVLTIKITFGMFQNGENWEDPMLRKTILATACAVAVAMMIGGCGKQEQKPSGDEKSRETMTLGHPEEANNNTVEPLLSIGGTYKFGDDVEKGPVGSALIHPLTSSSALFFLDLSQGAPSYNTGRLYGQITIKNNIGTFTEANDYLDCTLKFKFSPKQLEIITEDRHGNCGFGGNVYADNKYKQIDASIPKYYIGVEDDTIFFNENETVEEKTVERNDGGYITDSRDNKRYRTVKIGNLTWMAENLNYEAENSWCHDDDENNCQKLGRLYDWDAAIKACPDEWRLPDTANWENLLRVAGGPTELRSKTGWGEWSDPDIGIVSGNGTDDYGLSVLPAVGGNGYWLSTVENESGNAYYRSMDLMIDLEMTVTTDKTSRLSVRCVQNTTGSKTVANNNKHDM